VDAERQPKPGKPLCRPAHADRGATAPSKRPTIEQQMSRWLQTYPGSVCELVNSSMFSCNGAVPAASPDELTFTFSSPAATKNEPGHDARWSAGIDPQVIAMVHRWQLRHRNGSCRIAPTDIGCTDDVTGASMSVTAMSATSVVVTP
jgi:hypothetical protein